MLNKYLISLALFCAGTAWADSWDSNANLDAAMNKAVATYKAKGVAGLVDASENCLHGLDQSRRNRNVGKDVEYCIALAAAGSYIDRSVSSANNFPSHQYFNLTDLAVRMIYTLEVSRIVTQPEQAQQYLVSRITKINQAMHSKLR